MPSKNKDVYIDLAQMMVDYYDRKIVNNNKKVKALKHYKFAGYTLINQILFKKCEYHFSFGDIVDQWQNGEKHSLKELMDAMFKEFQHELAIAMEAIQMLDKIITDAPPINTQITVYRGMKTDIYDDLVCEDNKFYYTFPTYVSTSFSSFVSNNFKGRHGVFFTLILPPHTKGIYLPWTLEYKQSIGNSEIDNEFEYLMLRGSKFLVESIEYKQEPPYKGLSLYKNIPCEKQHPRYVRHYTMRLASQPTIAQLQKQYKNILSNVKVSFFPWEFEKVPANKTI